MKLVIFASISQDLKNIKEKNEKIYRVKTEKKDFIFIFFKSLLLWGKC